MKSKYFIVTALLLASVVATGCFNRGGAGATEEPFETGVIIDVTERNGEVVSAQPGDVVYVKLTGESAAQKQWSVISPTSSNAIELKDHKIVGLLDPEVLDGRFVDEWWLLVLKSAEIELQFDYGVLGEEAEDTFAVTIQSQDQ